MQNDTDGNIFALLAGSIVVLLALWIDYEIVIALEVTNAFAIVVLWIMLCAILMGIVFGIVKLYIHFFD